MSQHDVKQVSMLVRSLSHYYLNNSSNKLPEWFSTTLTECEFSNRLKNLYFTNLICEVNNSIVGYLSMKGDNHLYHLFVAEKQQGKGIAKKLWQHAMGICISEYYTLRSSLFAVPVYRNFGFIESGSALEKDGISFQPMELKN